MTRISEYPFTENVLAFIHQYLEQHGYAPTMREIAAGCYLSVSTVQKTMDRLELYGCITRPHNEDGRRLARAIALRDPATHDPRSAE